MVGVGLIETGSRAIGESLGKQDSGGHTGSSALDTTMGSGRSMQRRNVGERV